MLENSSNERCSCLRRLGQLVLSLVAGDYIWSCVIVVHTSYGLVSQAHNSLYWCDVNAYQTSLVI